MHVANLHAMINLQRQVGFAGTMPVNLQALADDLGTMVHSSVSWLSAKGQWSLTHLFGQDSTDEVDALQVAVAILQNQGGSFAVHHSLHNKSHQATHGDHSMID